MTSADVHIRVDALTMAYGLSVIQRDLSFDIRRGDVFVIMGGSGCGKSTLLKHLIGLLRPREGDILYSGESFVSASSQRRDEMRRGWGISYQTGGLFSAMTLGENVAIPLQQYSDYTPGQVDDVVDYKLALVGLTGYRDYYPSEISGGMRKRAALARAIALDPEVLFFDEPSAGLDPISSRRLDELILQAKETLGATVVMVTHELPSIFEIANNSVYLDAQSKTMIAYGDPRDLKTDSDQPVVRQFLTRELNPETESPHV